MESSSSEIVALPQLEGALENMPVAIQTMATEMEKFVESLTRTYSTLDASSVEGFRGLRAAITQDGQAYFFVVAEMTSRTLKQLEAAFENFEYVETVAEFVEHFVAISK